MLGSVKAEGANTPITMMIGKSRKSFRRLLRNDTDCQPSEARDLPFATALDNVRVSRLAVFKKPLEAAQMVATIA